MVRKSWKYFLASVAVLAAFGCGGSPEPERRPTVRPGPGVADRAPAPTPPETEPMPEAVRLTEGMAYDASPCWSPDGTKIAYSSYSRGSQNIMMLYIDYHADRLSATGEPVMLTEDNFTDRDPSWSTEGNRIAFSSDRSGNFKLFTVDILSRELTELDFEGIQPTWSPAGDRKAFVYRNNIAIIRFNEKPERTMLTTSGFNEFPSWAPDGTGIVFSAGYNIVRTDDLGGSRRNLTASSWNSYSDWCRSRDRIVFVSNRKGAYNLWKMNSDGSGRVQLTDTPNVERFPRWSHDGRWVAFQADYEGSFDIWAIRVD